MKDEKILKLIKKKDEKGLAALADKYEKLLQYIASGILGNRIMDVEECVNDAYYKIWTNIDRYDLNRASFKTYLKVIVRNTALNRIRDINRTQSMLYTDDISDVLKEYADYCDNPEKKAVQKEDIEVLEDIIKDLAKKDQELVIRRYFYLQSSKKISESMDMSVTAIDSRLSRLRVKIKQEFERRNQDE